MSEEIIRPTGLTDLINYSQTVEKFFGQDSLTTEQKKEIVKKLKNLVLIAAKINKGYILNKDEIEMLGKEIGTVGQKIDSKVFGIKTQIKETFEENMEQIRGFVDSHIRQKQEESKQITSQETALIKSPERKGAFKRLFNVLREDSNKWQQVKQEDGSIKLINEDGETRAVIKGGSETTEKDISNAKKSFGFIAKMKAFYVQEKAGSTLPTYEEKASAEEKREKAKAAINGIKQNAKEIEGTLSKAEKAALELADRHGENAKKGGKTIEDIKSIIANKNGPSKTANKKPKDMEHSL